MIVNFLDVEDLVSLKSILAYHVLFYGSSSNHSTHFQTQRNNLETILLKRLHPNSATCLRLQGCQLTSTLLSIISVKWKRDWCSAGVRSLLPHIHSSTACTAVMQTQSYHAPNDSRKHMLNTQSHQPRWLGTPASWRVGSLCMRCL